MILKPRSPSCGGATLRVGRGSKRTLGRDSSSRIIGSSDDWTLRHSKLRCRFALVKTAVPSDGYDARGHPDCHAAFIAYDHSPFYVIALVPKSCNVPNLLGGRTSSSLRPNVVSDGYQWLYQPCSCFTRRHLLCRRGRNGIVGHVSAGSLAHINVNDLRTDGEKSMDVITKWVAPSVHVAGSNFTVAVAWSRCCR